MANKNTLRKRRAMEKTYKRGCPCMTEKNERFRPKLDQHAQIQVQRIREISEKLYAQSA